MSINQRQLGVDEPTEPRHVVTLRFLKDFVRRPAMSQPTDDDSGNPEVGNPDTDFLGAFNAVEPDEDMNGNEEVGEPDTNFLGAFLGN